MRPKELAVGALPGEQGKALAGQRPAAPQAPPLSPDQAPVTLISVHTSLESNRLGLPRDRVCPSSERLGGLPTNRTGLHRGKLSLSWYLFGLGEC